MEKSDTEVSKLIIAVVQSQDSDMVEMTLDQVKIPYVKLPSTGGFLLEKNTTFLVACDYKRECNVMELLGATAKKRVSYVAATMDSTPFPIIVPAETMVGGVTIFTLDVEHFEEY
ncbi:MAG TPA: hypothetical protein GX730_02515 [Chloroflexi bacterium]|jgi:uncharacterized protein YaaQ|nr:cyclic-di-AMP receptor [Anaerolineaceae bacterium]HHX08295.1 hypothetical protein [Chloroflexota bacterium]